METFLVRVWVPAPDQGGLFPGTATLHGHVQHVGRGPSIPFRGMEQLVSLLETGLARPQGDPLTEDGGAPTARYDS